MITCGILIALSRDPSKAKYSDLNNKYTVE